MGASDMFPSHPQRLTLQVVEEFIADLKECVGIARANPSGKGDMVALYGTFFVKLVVSCKLDWSDCRPGHFLCRRPCPGGQTCI